MKCNICKSAKFSSELVSEVFSNQNRYILVENIPAQFCQICGEKIFSRETTENIRKLIHEGKKSTKTVKLEVFEYA